MSYTVGFTIDNVVERIKHTDPFLKAHLSHHLRQGFTVLTLLVEHLKEEVTEQGDQLEEILKRQIDVARSIDDALETEGKEAAAIRRDVTAYYNTLNELSGYFPIRLNGVAQKKLKKIIDRANTEAEIHFYTVNHFFGRKERKTDYYFKSDLQIFYIDIQKMFKKDCITITLDPGEEIRTRNDYVTHVVMPLVFNARDHAFPERYGHIFISYGTSQTEEGIYYIAVANSGVCIHQAVLPRIFERGFTTREEKQRHGIGLWAVKEFVETNGGTIGVDSIPGRTQFIVRIPYQTTETGHYIQT